MSEDKSEAAAKAAKTAKTKASGDAAEPVARRPTKQDLREQGLDPSCYGYR